MTKGNLEKLLRTLQEVESKCAKMRASAAAKSDNDFEQAARDLHTWAAEKGNELRAKYET
jgi:predicted RNA-binding protein with RPS1 domain